MSFKTNICKECGIGYSVRPYRREKTLFCSFKCGGRFRARTTLNVGPKPHMVGNNLRAGLRPANAFVSNEIRGSANPNWKDGLELLCNHCGTGFSQKPWMARQNGVAKFCGRPCFEASGCFDGEKSTGYVGGVTTYRGKGWPTIRAAVVADQDGNCDSCGKHVGKSLPVHHKRPFREFTSADEANERRNLIGLCQSCHMKVEHAYNQPDMFCASRSIQEAAE
ncbi:HNH endonuclease [Phyllobacterium sp. 22229]|uniref:HNH endonuclease n=1 Tax=Phyllobacterium sp. 22229 TaxID=3453895 RepID=UPI003F856587